MPPKVFVAVDRMASDTEVEQSAPAVKSAGRVLYEIRRMS
jgi:hypothetical protein